MNIDKNRILTLTPSTSKNNLTYYLGNWIINDHIIEGDTFDAEEEINKSRTELQNKAKEISEEFDYVLLLDDMIETTEEGLDELLNQYNGGPIAVKINDGRSHHCFHEDTINCSCCFMDKETYFSIDYMKEPYTCQCYKIPNVKYAEGISFIKINTDIEGPSDYGDEFGNVHLFEKNEEGEWIEKIYTQEECDALFTLSGNIEEFPAYIFDDFVESLSAEFPQDEENIPEDTSEINTI